MNVFYGASLYRSFARTAHQYRSIIGEFCQLVPSADRADLVFLHCEPVHYLELYERFPILSSKYVVGCAVWEADALPSSYIAGLRLVDEVWTPSAYCRQTLARGHGNVQVIPHIVDRDLTFHTSDVRCIRGQFDYDDNALYLLFVGRMGDPRKNVKQLLSSFSALAEEDSRLRLLIRDSSREPWSAPLPNKVSVISQPLTDHQINALYACSSCYVSPHHAEGWGLTLSDAMMFDLPTIATGYSGNLEFMDRTTEYLAEATIDSISPQDCKGYFLPSMRWAYPIQADLTAQVHAAVANIGSRAAREKAALAKRNMEQFLTRPVTALIHQRLLHVAESLGHKLSP